MNTTTTKPLQSTRTTAATAIGLALLGLGAPVAASPATAATAEPVAVHPARHGDHTTTLTLAVDDCEGCGFVLRQARETSDGEVKTWETRRKKVRDGVVTFTVPHKRTVGMSMTVDAPWDGHLGYETTVALRYRGKQVGDAVTFAQARGKKRASACWEGVGAGEVTLPVTVRKVRVDGVHGRVAGSIAYLEETTSWLEPMRRAFKGVLGSQDVNVCG